MDTMPKSRRYTQRELISELEQHGWVRAAGGKHQVKMIKEGRRPVTVPMFKGKTLPIGLTQAILKQAEIDKDLE